MESSISTIHSVSHLISVLWWIRYNRHQTDQGRIRAAWNFVTRLNDYVGEIEETPRFLLETLLMGGGDCEDSAILLGSSLYSMAPERDVTF